VNNATDFFSAKTASLERTTRLRGTKLPLGGLLLLLSFGAFGCGVAAIPGPVLISHPPVFRPASPQQVSGLPHAIAAIITVSTQDLGLPPVEPLYLHLYKDANNYAAGVRPFSRLREDSLRFTLAQPHENRLHVNMERTRGQSWAALLRILAHDYGHNVEYVLAGSTQRRSEWMSEGFADWIAAKVIDSLGWENYSSSLSRAERELSRYGSSPLPLSQLDAYDDWVKVLEQPKGRIGTYNLAFLAVHNLIEKKGVAGMMDYFSTGDFPGSFGLTEDEFQREVERRVNDLIAANRLGEGAFRAERPEWKVGYQWVYALGAPGLNGAVLFPNEITREEIFDDVPVYVLTVGKNEYPHSKDKLGVLATFFEGRTVSKNNPPSLPLDWPLATGKRWHNAFAVDTGDPKQSETIDTEAVVAGLEEVRVPAGVFTAFRIETYASDTGELISEQWYAPRVRWLVKTKTYREEGVIEQQLVSFRLD
jgi:hypothetical protein